MVVYGTSMNREEKVILRSVVLILVCAALLAAPVFAAVDVSLPVIAEVNGQIILRRDVEVIVLPIYKQLEARYEGDVLEKKKKEFFKQSLDSLIEQKLLLQIADEYGVDVDDEVVDARMEALAKKVGGWPRLLDALAKVGISFEEKAKQVHDEIIVRRILSSVVLPRVYASPADVREYYNEHKDEFTEHSKYKISQIIVWRSNYSTEEEAKKKLDMIRVKLAEGADFASVARQHSDGPHSKDGGDWGFVGPNDLVKELAEILPEMKVGGVSSPVQTKVGFHIVKLTDKKDPVLKPFADVYSGIESTLRSRTYLREIDDYLKILRRRGFVKVYRQAVPELSTE